MKGYLPSAEEDRRDTLIALYFAKCLVSIALRRVDGRDTGGFLSRAGRVRTVSIVDIETESRLKPLQTTLLLLQSGSARQTARTVHLPVRYL
jgi:hypothetical protein